MQNSSFPRLRKDSIVFEAKLPKAGWTGWHPFAGSQRARQRANYSTKMRNSPGDTGKHHLDEGRLLTSEWKMMMVGKFSWGGKSCLESDDFCWNVSLSGLVHPYCLVGSGFPPLGHQSIFFFLSNWQLLQKMRKWEKWQFSKDSTLPEGRHKTLHKWQGKPHFLLRKLITDSFVCVQEHVEARGWHPSTSCVFLNHAPSFCSDGISYWTWSSLLH